LDGHCSGYRSLSFGCIQWTPFTEEKGMEIEGNLVDIHTQKIFSAKISVKEGKITNIAPNSHRGRGFILPRFVDAHVHIESTMLPPCEFARMAVRHGTISCVADPHEIANVLGISGVEFMLDNARKSPFKFFFGAPSCVPASTEETSGARLGPEEVRELLEKPQVKCLSEVMDFPGVIQEKPEVLAKIQSAKQLEKPIDGHAPGLYGEDLKKYVAAGIQTDHECSTLTEAKEKLSLGMKIIVREGSSARNLSALFPILQEAPESCMFCTDDLQPDHLLLGHINALVKKAVQLGMDPILAITCASKNPIEHYDLDVGLIRVGDPADFIIVEDLIHFRTLETYIKGECVFRETSSIPHLKTKPINKFQIGPKKPKDFAIPSKEGKCKVIEAFDGELFTKSLELYPKIEGNEVVSDPKNDILKIAVINRYKEAPVALGLIKNFGLEEGAIASSVAHDSHNVVAVGVRDEDLCDAVNAIIRAKGGIAVSHNKNTDILPLPIAGLMSTFEGEEVARRFSDLDQAAKGLGTKMSAPFMTLSFMALLVIPELKMSDKGLFDGKAFKLTSLFS